MNKLAEQLRKSIKEEVSHSKDVNPDNFLRYIGSKQEIAKQLLHLIPKHEIYVEPFMGSAAFFFKKPKSKTTILNDINGDLTNMFCVLRDHTEFFIEWCWMTPFSEDFHRTVYQAYINKAIWNKVNFRKKACGYFYLLQNAFNESVANLGSPSTKISKGKQKWCKEVCNILFNCSKKLDNVLIYNRSYQELLKDEAINKPDTFWYLDPPYTMAEDKGYYKHNFSPNNHYEFRMACDAINGKFMVSYDNSPMIKDIFKNFNIMPVDGFKNEIIITNYDTQQQPNSQQVLI